MAHLKVGASLLVTDGCRPSSQHLVRQTQTKVSSVFCFGRGTTHRLEAVRYTGRDRELCKTKVGTRINILYPTIYVFFLFFLVVKEFERASLTVLQRWDGLGRAKTLLKVVSAR